MDEVLTPDDLGGTPVVTTTNSWWDLATQALQSATDVTLARSTGVRAATGGVVASNSRIIALGNGGVNPAAAATPGGRTTFSRIASDLTGGAGGSSLLMLALLALVAWKFLKR